jgi:hypothetical protein
MTTLKKSKRDEVTRFNMVQAQVKGVDIGMRSVRGPLAKAYMWHTWTGVGSVHVIYIGFSPTGCTSIRIAVTLG